MDRSFSLAGVALAVVVAGATAAALLRRRRRAAQSADIDAAAAPAPGGAVAAEAMADVHAPHDNLMAALQAELAASATRLWSRALGVSAGQSGAPAGHRDILAAARKALDADPLAERYFPRRPLLMPQLLAAVNDPNAPPTKLAAIIGQDPVLTGNILKLANSVFFRLSATPVESLQRAVVVCGTDGLASLAATALVQPVFRSGGAGHSHFPGVLWERCTRASAAAELCARQWCASERQTAQLLALLSALGPLAAYRIVEDQYRAQPEIPPSPAVFLEIIDRHGVALAARIASLWQTPARMINVLNGQALREARDNGQASLLERALRAGELLATLSLLADEGQLSDEECGALALAAGIPAPLFASVWARFHHADEAALDATHVA